MHLWHHQRQREHYKVQDQQYGHWPFLHALDQSLRVEESTELDKALQLG